MHATETIHAAGSPDGTRLFVAVKGEYGRGVAQFTPFGEMHDPALSQTRFGPLDNREHRRAGLAREVPLCHREFEPAGQLAEPKRSEERKARFRPKTPEPNLNASRFRGRQLGRPTRSRPTRSI